MVRCSLPKVQPKNHRALRHSFCYRDVTNGVPGSKSPRGHPKVTIKFGKVTVTLATSSKIAWQAGMSKRMSEVRSYVPLPVTQASGYTRIPDEKARKTGKHWWYPGMCKGMNSLAGYVACRDRDNWDF